MSSLFFAFTEHGMMIKARKMKWTEPVAHVEEMGNAYGF
jgi:hypothetical protein